ncbi:hypothetical protein [Desulfovibrio sp. 86]|uniref:Uncharacterized protein n=1 Tax=uncultured Desulfovibrio sp. TaxID=167968 RepID=A0A212L6S1_9BACT|nr:hypothetical protein [Desulfovibrio sp. 86]SCM73205.1 hypothetical protein KL86DES1_21131 [uncultured Desulfovibrio sp.]VZH34029.1 conserved protein of unknown function [Desulfovibrio sp. 86]
MSEEEKKTKPKSREYPANTLSKTLEFLEKFKGYPQGKPISYDAAAKELGVSSNTKSFRYLISSARQYGLISTAAGQTMLMLEPASRLIRPTEQENILRQLKIECFKTPRMYSELIAQYQGQSMPAITTLENVLINYHGIVQTIAKNAAKTFIDTANELGVVINGVIDLEVTHDLNPNSNKEIQKDEDSQKNETGIQNDLTDIVPSMKQSDSEEFALPITVPLSEQRRAILHMPINTEKEDAEYVLEMITLMFRKLYGINRA